MKKVLSAIIIIASTAFVGFGQYSPITIEQKTEQSDLIVEGKVIGQRTFIGKGEEVYTENRLLISQVLKGELSEQEISIVTWGGKYDTKVITWTHLPQLSINQYGVFFLNPSLISENGNSTNQNRLFDIFSGNQGIYHLIFEEDGNISANSILEKYNHADTLYTKLKAGSKPNADFISSHRTGKEDCISYLIKPIEPTDFQQNSSVSADIMVRVESGTYNLYKANLKIKYNTEIFGESIVGYSNLTYTNGDLSSSAYSLAFSDISTNEFELVLQANTTNTSQLYDLNGTYVKIATISLNIIGWSPDEPFSIDNNSGIIENYYVEEESNLIKEFDCTKVHVGKACDIDVTDFNPKTAAGGVNLMSANSISGTVTIEGTGFTNPVAGQPKPDDYRVKFKTVGGGWIAPFEGDYISWTDTKIEVKVPSIGYDNNSDDIIADFNTDIACTGIIRVCEDTYVLGIRIPCGCNDDTDNELYVPFSARNTFQTNANGFKESVRTVLRSFNGSGGYTIYFHPNFISNTGAVAAFKRALTTWRCATQVNFDVDDVNPIPPNANGLAIVEFSNLPIGTNSVTRGATLFSPGDCDSEPNIDFSFLPNYRIRFNSNLNWHTGTSMPGNLDWNTTGDLESTALHELGHAHLLNHTCNGDNVMVSPGPLDFRRDLHNDDEDGGDHISMVSNGTNDPECPSSPMELTLFSECDVTSVIEINGHLVDVEVFPNPTQSDFTVSFSGKEYVEGQIIVLNNLGRTISVTPTANQQTMISMDAPSGIYYVVFRGGNGAWALIGKISKH